MMDAAIAVAEDYIQRHGIAGGGFKINTQHLHRGGRRDDLQHERPGCPNCSSGNYGKVEINTSASAHMTGPTTAP